LTLLNSVLAHNDFSSEDRKSLNDNAIGACGKIVLFQSSLENSLRGSLMKKFLGYLPLKNDNEEA
jgi:hypothetical protein